jgi:hypothetical protein
LLRLRPRSYDHANSLGGSQKKDALANAASMVEGKLTIIGVTAIEDELQDEASRESVMCLLSVNGCVSRLCACRAGGGGWRRRLRW